MRSWSGRSAARIAARPVSLEIFDARGRKFNPLVGAALARIKTPTGTVRATAAQGSANAAALGNDRR
jgi:hypothetical protein